MVPWTVNTTPPAYDALPCDATAAYREGPATRLRFTHSPQFPLHLLDPAHAPPAA